MAIRRVAAIATVGGFLLGGGCRAGEVALDGVYDGINGAISSIIVSLARSLFGLS